MKLTQIKNEDALKVLADIIEPVGEIVKDKGFEVLMVDSATPKMDIVQYILKIHPDKIVRILAAMHQIPVDEYEFNLVSLTQEVMDMMDDEELLNLFRSQDQLNQATSSGLVTENIGEADQI